MARWCFDRVREREVSGDFPGGSRAEIYVQDQLSETMLVPCRLW
jgi:hypothetical protein